MALVKVKPTSPGRRGVVKVVTPDLYKGKPHAPLLESQSRNAGRNNNGRITVRHQGGGHKQHYRLLTSFAIRLVFQRQLNILNMIQTVRHTLLCFVMLMVNVVTLLLRVA